MRAKKRYYLLYCCECDADRKRHDSVVWIAELTWPMLIHELTIAWRLEAMSACARNEDYRYFFTCTGQVQIIDHQISDADIESI